MPPAAARDAATWLDEMATLDAQIQLLQKRQELEDLLARAAATKAAALPGVVSVSGFSGRARAVLRFPDGRLAMVREGEEIAPDIHVAAITPRSVMVSLWVGEDQMRTVPLDFAPPVVAGGGGTERPTLLPEAIRLAVAVAAAAVVVVLWPQAPPLVVAPPPPPPVLAQVRPAPVVQAAPAPRGLDRAEVARAAAAATEAWLRQPVAAEVAGAWLTILRTLPLSAAGYRPRALECGAEACRADWVWTGGDLDDAILARLPGALQPVASHKDYLSQVRTRLVLPAGRAERLRPLASSEVAGFLRGLMVSLTRPGVIADVAPPKTPLVLPLEVDGTRLSETVGDIGSVRVLVPSLIEAEHVLHTLAGLPVYLERGTFSLNGGTVSLQLEVRYVVLRS